MYQAVNPENPPQACSVQGVQAYSVRLILSPTFPSCSWLILMLVGVLQTYSLCLCVFPSLVV
ncbi:hypothetical protein BpHYR1_012557 [Brachionus plicatilis]|uniref:Uncharacterized protein n=1 Tax=Brachionus plicatilis TaxID=10195 RepID=A0A3M7PIV9_BRAPC|nr:hypothetical protein BpHYR1_012557 [Brachionus plicatilis]